MTIPVIATGWSLHVPGVDLSTAPVGPAGRPLGGWASEEAVPADRAAAVLGRKGLLYKEPSTRLAMCAVHRALGWEAGARPDGTVDPGTAVVACSNLGNVETVAKVTRTIAAEGGRGVSVLDAPNVSSNVVASTVALWFGFGGPNLMLCSGSTAGLDGLRLAWLLLRSGRADRVVLVGTEPDDEVAATLHGFGAQRSPLRGGAACLVLRRHRPGLTGVLVTPADDATVLPAVTLGHGGTFDPVDAWGDCYGAQGVVSLALAAHLVADEGHRQVGVRCDGEDGTCAALVGQVPAP
jgi:3-oxoacyl-[acyl-carrier-protein] synthase II